MPQKSSNTIAINLRLPKPLHGRLARAAKKANRSLNTFMIERLAGAPDPLAEIEAIVRRIDTTTQSIEKILSDKKDAEQ